MAWKMCFERRALYFLVVDLDRVSTETPLLQSTKHKVQSSTVRIKQTRPLTGLNAEVLISELGGHASARGAIQEANLN